MKSVIVLLVMMVLTGFAFWFVWMNRASEKIVASTLPIAVAAVIGIFLAGWVFGGEADYETAFPVCYMLDLETKLPLDTVEEMNNLPMKNPMIFRSHRFEHGPSPVPELKNQRPDLFLDTTKNDFCRNIYHHLLQRSLIDFLTVLYRGSWKAEAFRFDVGSMNFGRYGVVPQAAPAATVVETKNIERILDGNFFARIHRWPSPQFSLPPNSKVELRAPAGGSDDNGTGEITLSNPFCTIKLVSEIAFPVRTIGEYRLLTGLSEEQASLATNMYLLRVNIHYNRLRSGHPDMKAHKEWATQLTGEIKDQFDEQVIWAKVKGDVQFHFYAPQH
jgi:hypothetical protein